MTLAAAAAHDLLPSLDEPVTRVLPELTRTPAREATWLHLLTMTRGAETAGPWDVDAVTALDGGQVAHIARAPLRTTPGSAFVYDNGASHLLSAAATAVVGEAVSDFAARELFEPLGIGDTEWTCDPDGVPFGYAHLRLTADDLGRLGQLLLDDGRVGDLPLLSPGFLAGMTTPATGGGPPEDLPYGWHIWVDDDLLLAGGWAGQHVVVVPSSRAVVVTTSDPGFDPGPPARDEMPVDWLPALTLVRELLLPVLR